MDDLRRNFLRDKRRVILDRLSKLEPELVRQIALIDAELAASDAERSQKYSKFRLAWEAIHAYLKEVGRPVPWDEIIFAVVAGGFVRGDRDPISVVRDSIEYHVVRHSPDELKRFRPWGPVEDKILGLYEWPDSLEPRV